MNDCWRCNTAEVMCPFLVLMLCCTYKTCWYVAAEYNDKLLFESGSVVLPDFEVTAVYGRERIGRINFMWKIVTSNFCYSCWLLEPKSGYIIIKCGVVYYYSWRLAWSSCKSFYILKEPGESLPDTCMVSTFQWAITSP